MKVTSRSVSALRIHPLVEGAWELPQDHPDFSALVESIRTLGILDPLKVTADGLVVDGRHRLRVAAIIKLEYVPCTEVPEGDAASIALDTLVARRHMATKGQMAYCAFPILREETRVRRRGAAGEFAAGDDTIVAFARRIGVSREEVFRAIRLHGMFAKDSNLRTEWEPRIMDPVDPVGLGAALAGIAGQAASQGVTPQRNSALRKWEVAWKNLTRPASSWDRWTPEERDYAAGAVTSAVTSLPDPLLDVLRDALRTARRARNGGAE